jgi:hypothetical protein
MTASDASAGATKHPVQVARKVAGESFLTRSQRQSAQPRSGVSEAGVWAGQPLSTEIFFQWPTSLCRGEGNTTDGVIASHRKRWRCRRP